MKKISLFALAIMSGAVMFAQSTVITRTPMEVKPRFGVKGGVNLATFNVSEDEFAANSAPYNVNRKTSFNAGVFVNIPLGGMLRLQPELIYSGQGSKYRQNVRVSMLDQPIEEDLHYLNVPVMFQIVTPGGFFVEAGPQVGLLIDAEREIGTNAQGEELKDMRKRIDVGAGAGLGYMTRVGLGVSAKYVRGFSNVWNAEDDNMESAGKMKNDVIGLSLFYQFGAGK
ncbi:MAG TPA: porin family protein [Chitinophagaceae bacterium]|jgi:hypothetical protein|nr:porin family protein [Chitinophagaceae bacterium]